MFIRAHEPILFDCMMRLYASNTSRKINRERWTKWDMVWAIGHWRWPGRYLRDGSENELKDIYYDKQVDGLLDGPNEMCFYSKITYHIVSVSVHAWNTWKIPVCGPGLRAMGRYRWIGAGRIDGPREISREKNMSRENLDKIREKSEEICWWETWTWMDIFPRGTFLNFMSIDWTSICHPTETDPMEHVEDEQFIRRYRNVWTRRHSLHDVGYLFLGRFVPSRECG